MKKEWLEMLKQWRRVLWDIQQVHYQPLQELAPAVTGIEEAIQRLKECCCDEKAAKQAHEFAAQSAVSAGRAFASEMECKRILHKIEMLLAEKMP